MFKCPHCERDTAKKENHYCKECAEALVQRETDQAVMAMVARTAYRQAIRDKAYAARRRELARMRRRAVRDMLMRAFRNQSGDDQRTERNG